MKLIERRSGLVTLIGSTRNPLRRIARPLGSWRTFDVADVHPRDYALMRFDLPEVVL